MLMKGSFGGVDEMLQTMFEGVLSSKGRLSLSSEDEVPHWLCVRKLHFIKYPQFEINLKLGWEAEGEKGEGRGGFRMRGGRLIGREGGFLMTICLSKGGSRG